jgi:uncharacterized SAM-binding protein YcdF (DUF218 family)
MALRVARGLPNATIVFSVDESIPELRDVTLRYFRNMGWPSKRILTPPAAHNTFGETKSAFDILKENNADSVFVVSSWYHIPRIWVMWRYLGFKGKIISYASLETINPWGSLAWEAMGFMKFFGKILLRKTNDPSTYNL